MKRRRRPLHVPGRPPGSIDITDDQGELRISITDYSLNDITEAHGLEVDAITPPPEGIRRWIHVQGTPNRKLLGALSDQFDVHNLILEDIATAGQRIKVEDYSQVMFTVLRVPEPGGPSDEHQSDLSMLLTNTTLITIHESPDAPFFEPILTRLRSPHSLLRRNHIDFLYHAIVDLVVDSYFPEIETLDDRAVLLEKSILDKPEETHLRQLHDLREAAQHMRSTLWALRDIVSRVERSTHRFVREDTLFYFRDIHDHVVHLIDEVTTLRETANGLMELHMSGVSNRMNEVMKVLTVISTVFIPLSFLTGLYGMNFQHMPELSKPWAYPALLGVMLVVAGGMLLFFKRRKWF
ncbi:MAG: magnesium/cobalt transporter CorA [Spirochaetales bacterium]